MVWRAEPFRIWHNRRQEPVGHPGLLTLQERSLQSSLAQLQYMGAPSVLHGPQSVVCKGEANEGVAWGRGPEAVSHFFCCRCASYLQ